MLELQHIDLRDDTRAALFVKDEVVQVAFAITDGALISLEGPNRYAAGDALLTSSNGERWSVSRERFEAKYLPVASCPAGQDGAYRARAVPVLARQIAEPFTLRRSAGGDVLVGAALDWVMQYAPGDYGLCANERFARVYRAYRPG